MGTKSNIYNSVGNAVGTIQFGKETLIFFHDTLVGSILDQEYFNLEGWYMGKWMGKAALGKIFDLGMERHGYMIATTEINDRPTPIDVGKFLVRNRGNFIVGTADDPLGGGALALFYHRENIPLAHLDFKKRRVHVMDFTLDNIALNATQDFLQTRQENILDEMKRQRTTFTSWLEFFLSEFENPKLIRSVRNYEAKMGLILETISRRFVESHKVDQFLITEQMRRFLISSFYYMATWDNVRDALNQRLISKYAEFHFLADHILNDLKNTFHIPFQEANIALIDKTRTEIFSCFYMDYGAGLGINNAVSPLALMGIPFEEMDEPWNWMNVGFEMGLEVYHNVKGLKEELKVSLYEFLFFNFQDEVKVHWFPWRHFLFADIFSILLFGPTMTLYFSDTYFQEMLELQIEFNREKNIWEQEPMEYVRFLVQCTLLKRLGFGTIARELEAKITPIAMNPEHIIVDGNIIEMERFLDPAKQMIALILNSSMKSFNDRHLTSFLSFTPSDQRKVIALKDSIQKGEVIDDETNWRHLLPAFYLCLTSGFSRSKLLKLGVKKAHSAHSKSPHKEENAPELAIKGRK